MSWDTFAVVAAVVAIVGGTVAIVAGLRTGPTWVRPWLLTTLGVLGVALGIALVALR